MAVQSPSSGPVRGTVFGFDWDDGNRAKCRRHGLTEASIEAVLSGEVAVFPDPLHSGSEKRLKAIGTTAAGRKVLCVFTVRRSAAQTLLRPISARFMHRKEVAYYEKASAGTDE